MSDRPPEGVPSNVQASEGWTDVIKDMETTAADYRDRGWETLKLHPGDSVLVDSDRRIGLDVLLPGPEFEELEALVDQYSFDSVEVFRAARSGTVYVLVVERDTDAEVAALVPGYYDRTSSADALDSIRESGTIRLFCRRLNDDTVEFAHTDPAPFLPATP